MFVYSTSTSLHSILSWKRFTVDARELKRPLLQHPILNVVTLQPLSSRSRYFLVLSQVLLCIPNCCRNSWCSLEAFILFQLQLSSFNCNKLHFNLLSLYFRNLLYQFPHCRDLFYFTRIIIIYFHHCLSSSCIKDCLSPLHR